MTEPSAETTAATHPAGDGVDGRLAVIAHNTSESLELLRSLVTLLLAKEAGHDGPRLEDLIAALLAQQRDMLTALRRLEADVAAIARRVLDEAEPDGLNGHRAPPRPC